MTSPTPSEPRTGQTLYHGAALAPLNAWLVVIAATVTIWVGQIVAFAAGAPRVVAAAIGFALAFGGLALLAHKQGIAIFGVRWPRPRFLLAAVLIGSAAWYVNLAIVTLIEPPGDTKELQRVVEQAPLVPTLLVVALMPAVTEELIFRGVLARSLAARYSAVFATAVSAGIFGLYHVQPTAQVISAALLGLALGFLAIRARSVVPGMLVHLLNNTIAIVISREEIPALEAWLDTHQVAMLIAAPIIVVLGLVIAARGRA